MYPKEKAINQMNDWGRSKTPFLFIIDFKAENSMLYPLNDIPDNIAIQTPLWSKCQMKEISDKAFKFDYTPIPENQYAIGFNKVIDELNYGNSYLLNLTFPTVLNTSLSLFEIFNRSIAPYKLLVDDKFVVFSPESFVQINNGMISSYPMKGTISANIPDAATLILEDHKEKAEHATIVDLIRNDLNMVADNVRIAKYRYIDKIDTLNGPLLQVSSKIEGELRGSYQATLGSIVYSMLPAGSISGAPKKKTLEIIESTEIAPRGFFTGIFGVYDGESLDSGVMIRFIEQTPSGLVFKSGGGITAQSNMQSEYEEMINKVYVPIV